MPISSVAVILGASIFLPLPATLPDPKPGLESLISHVYDIEGNEIAVFREFETSKPVEAADIPQVLKDAVVSSEDRSFYSHGGIDVRGILRALVADVRGGSVKQGGSTITQQYVRTAFEEVGTERTLARKIKEAILASQLDRQMSKEEILYRYLTTIYFGEGAYGVGAAAETYFRKDVKDLTVSEAAMLAGVIPAPSRYSPRVDPATAEIKRVHVVDLMLEQGYIDQPTHDAAVAQPLYVATDSACTPPGPPVTMVCPAEVQQSTQPWFTDYLAKWLEKRLPGGREQLVRGGLQIFTTLDPKLQAEAEDAVHKQLDGEDPDLQMAIVAVEPPTGYVRAIVGGRDFAASQVNNALGRQGGGTGRQAGSSFKPFVLATALAQGVPLTRHYSGAPFTVNGDQIDNYGGAVYGSLDLRTATWQSVNAVYAHLILDVGVDKTFETAEALGVDMPEYDASKFGASVALGAVEVNPLEMASAFGVFANGGQRAEPTPIIQVKGPDGRVVLDFSESTDDTTQAIPEAVADNVTDVLRGVLTNGTAAGHGIDRPAAGKTGTAQNNTDAWFVGYTPTLSTAVWMGHQSGQIEMHNINGVRNVTGGSIPAATWESFMRKALANVEITDFDEPAPLRSVAEQAQLEARRGFDPGDRMYPSGAGGGPYVESLEPPSVDAPTTTEQPTTTTTDKTTTTRPPIIN